MIRQRLDQRFQFVHQGQIAFDVGSVNLTDQTLGRGLRVEGIGTPAKLNV